MLDGGCLTLAIGALAYMTTERPSCDADGSSRLEP
jgi:hypothetical protein